MKQVIITFAVAASLLTACYDDKSSYITNPIDDVVLADANTDIRIGYLQELDFAPTLTQGGVSLDEGNYSYLWQINEIPRSNEFETIGTEKELHVTLTNSISTGAYTLTLTVSDLDNDLQYLFSWNLYVQSAFLDGLVVSDTKDGQSSDLTLVLNKQLTVNYDKEETIFRNIIASSTGAAYPALLSSLTPSLMSYITSSGLVNNLWAIDDVGNPVRFNCEDYSFATGRDVLLYQYEGQRATKILGLSNSFVSQSILAMMSTHGNYAVSGITSNSFSVASSAFSDTSMRDNICASRSYAESGYCAAAWVDDQTGRIVLADLSTSSVSLNYLENPTDTTPAYDAENLGNQSVVAAGFTYNEDIPALLLKNNTTGGYAIYTVTPYSPEEGHYTDPDNWEGWVTDVAEQPYAPRAKFDIPTAIKSRLDQAVDVTFCPKQAIFYIATADAVSAVLFANGTVTDGGTKFTPTDSGEKITSVKIYQQGQYRYSSGLCTMDTDGTIYRSLLALTNQAVIITTQKSDSEGFVYVVPMTQLGTGNLDATKALKYDGFGKILDVTTTGY